MAIALSQSHYRFGVDELTESTHGWYAAEDSPASLPLDTNCLLRINVQETGGSAAANLVQQFQYSFDGVVWNNITTTSSVARAVAVAAFANGANCTQRLSGTGTFESSGAGCTEDGSSGGNANDVAASGCTETELGFQLRSADLSQGDMVRFRLAVSGPTTSITYSVTPIAHVAIAESPAIGATTFTGQAPSRVVNHIAAAAVAALSFAGLQPSALITTPDTPIPVASGAVSLSGQAPKIPTLSIYLKDGGVTRATRYANLTGSQATLDFELSTEERDSIETWGDLSLSLVANGGQVEVAWAELETPEATTALSEAPALSALSLAGLAPTVSAGAPTITTSPGVGAMAVSGSAPSIPTFTVQLYVGDTSVASQQLGMYGAGLTTYEIAIPTTSISDWTALRVAMTANVQRVEVAWVEAEVPESAGAATTTPALGALTLAGLAPTAISAELSPLTVSPATASLSFLGLVPPASTIDLYMGPSATGTFIARRALEFTGSFATYSFVLTDAEFASITDWSDLHVVITADGEQLTVSWLALEAPERGASPSVGSITSGGIAPIPGTQGQGASAVAALAVTGTVPTLNRTYLVRPGAGSMATAGTTVAPVGVSDPPRGTMAFTGYNPLLQSGPVPHIVTVDTGSIAAGGVSPSAVQSVYEAPSSGSMSVAGVAPTLHISVLVEAGAMSMSGRAPLPSVTSADAIVVTPDLAEMSFAGAAPVATQAAIGPVALSWGSEALVQAGCSGGSLVSAGMTDDALEYAT